MTDDELMDMPVPSLLSPKGILFMWTTSSVLERSIDLLKHYGLEFRGLQFVWIKTKKNGVPIGAQGIRPSIVKPLTELVIAGSRVKMGRPLPLKSESICQTIFAPKGRHSEKPSDVHERLEAMYPNARKLEMFARGCRSQWTTWGNDPLVLAHMARRLNANAKPSPSSDVPEFTSPPPTNVRSPVTILVNHGLP